MDILFGIFWSALVKFWWSYRVFLYIGILAATGAWTLLDYVPSILGNVPEAPVVVYPKGVQILNSICNPPMRLCGNPDEVLIDPQIPGDDPSVVPRSYTLSPVQSLESYLLNFGQFALFIVSLLLILFHYKKQVGLFRYWVLVVLIFIAFLVGSLFIFDVVFF